MELVAETLRSALEGRAILASEWLKAQVSPEWFDCYGKRMQEYHLPKEEQERQAIAETIGRDGIQLLSAIYSEAAPEELRRHPAVEVLRQIWVQQYYQENGQVHWRKKGNQPPPGQIISSPYDPEAHYRTKRATAWVGYKVHSISRKPPPLCGVALHSSAGMAGAVGSAGREPWWSVKQTGSRRDKIPEKPPPLVVVRDFEVCHSLD